MWGVVAAESHDRKPILAIWIIKRCWEESLRRCVNVFVCAHCISESNFRPLCRDHIMPHYDTLWPTYTVTTCWETHSPAVDSWAGWRYRGAHPCVTPDVPSAPPLPSPTPPTPCLPFPANTAIVVSPIHGVSKGDLHQICACQKLSLMACGIVTGYMKLGHVTPNWEWVDWTGFDPLRKLEHLARNVMKPSLQHINLKLPEKVCWINMCILST